MADPNGPLCGCGRRGCVEAIASGRAIEAVSSQWDDPCDPKEVFARFRQNDEKATELVTRSAQAIANLIADLKIGLDMQKVVVGGSVGLAEGYLPLVQSLLSELPAVYHCELESAQFGQDAGLIGAAYWVKDCLLQAKIREWFMAKNGNILNTISSLYRSLTKTEKKIADAILLNPDLAVQAPLAEIAAHLEVGEATFVRFAVLSALKASVI